MIDFRSLSARKELFARITGIKLVEFLKIVEKVRPLWNKVIAKKKCHGRNSNLKTLENEILMVILYYRYYASHYFLGMQFNLDASNVCRHIQRLEPLLARAVSVNIETFKNAIIQNNDFISKCQQGIYPMYVAFDNKKMIGVISMRQDKVHISLLFVRKEYHRQGVATLLFKHLLADIVKDNPA